jgi:hypothetical protein
MPRKPARGNVPWGLVGMLVLVGAVERYVVRKNDHFMQTDPTNWRDSARASRHEATRADILCLGSSLVKFGLQARVIQRATGRKTQNLALYGAHMPATYFTLKHALQAGARPSVILVDCSDGPIERNHRHERYEGLTANMRSWPELLSITDSVDLAWTARDAGFLAEVMTARIFPSYKSRNEIRISILEALMGTDNHPFHVGAETLRANWAINNGTHIAPRLLSSSDTIAPRPDRPRPAKFPNDVCQRNKLTLAYTQRFLDLAAAHQIKVFWLLPPLRPAKQIQREKDGVDSYFTGLARWVVARSDGVVVIDGRNSGYAGNVFADTTHLDRQGGTTFSTDVAAIVKHALNDPSASARWVALPPYRDVVTDVPMEDLVQTLQARRARWFARNTARR